MRPTFLLVMLMTTRVFALSCSATLDAPAHKLLVRPPAGYHFNLDAPAPQLTAGGAALKVELSTAQATVELPAGANTIAARWFVCDDAKALCTVIREELTVDGDKVTSREPAAAPQEAHEPASGAPPAAGTVAHGFLVDRPEEALAQAKKERRPLMVDFFGIWCPPCNMLDETVFARAEFARASEAFVKLKLDADRETSWPLKERWRVGGYPTVIFATADGEEIDRIVGSRNLKEFLAKVQDALAHQAQPRAALEALAKSGDRAAVRRLSQLQLDHAEFKPVMHRLQKLKAEHPKEFSPEDQDLLTHALVGAAREALKAATGTGDAKAARADFVATLKTAVAEAGLTADALDHAPELADLLDADGDAAGATAARKQAIEASKAVEKQPELLAHEGLTLGDLLENRADLYAALKDEAATKATFSAAADAYGKDVADAGLSPATARGYNIERAFCLGKSGRTDEAIALYTTLEKSYPGEFTFLFAHAGLMDSLKQLPEAEALAKSAYAAAYGDNRLRAAERLAKIRRSRGDVEGATKVLDEALAAAKRPTDPHNRTHRYLDALEKLKADLSK